MMRLDKYLCEAGKGTRSEVKKMVRAGLVAVNGFRETDPGVKVDENHDEVSLAGERLFYVEKEYYMLNKPKGVISASRDSRHGSITVTDLIHEKIRHDLFPVGRLDKDTEGLLIITNDGDLSHRLLSPRNRVEKTYYAELDGILTDEAARRIMEGVDIGDKTPTLPCVISRLSDLSIFITVFEGRYHEIKRMMKTEGLSVKVLRRISFGSLAIDPALAAGEYRALTDGEIKLLKEV